MKTCGVCGKGLESRRRKSLYCSDACKQRSYRERLSSERISEYRAISNERSAKWRAANPERARELNRRWQERNRDKTRASRVRFIQAHPEHVHAKGLRIYGLTVTDYRDRLAAQGGVCAICAKPESRINPSTGVPRRLAVDHDHGTGAVRGILCHTCNRGLGYLGDDPDRLDAAARYLRSQLTP